MATTKIKGYNLTMSGISIGREVSCQATLTNNMAEADYKDTDSPMNPEQEVTSKSWSMQKDITELSTAEDLRALIAAALSTDSVRVDMSTGTSLLTGNALVNDLNIQATNRAKITASVQFQGTGAVA